MFDLIAKTHAGLEEVLAAELRALGAERVSVGERAVYFCGDTALMYRANMCLRTAYRILKPIYTLPVRNEQELYTKVKAINWSEYLGTKDTFAIDSVVHSQYFNHSQYVALKTKDAIADWFRDRLGRRPDVDVDNPTVRLNVHIADDTLTLSLDASGDSLHLRGYRRDKNEAPLNEVLAAGLILLSGWQGDTTFADAMCGSGTLPIEAAMIARNIAPNAQRKQFGFMRWKDFNGKLFKQVQAEVKAQERAINFPIVGSDISSKNIFISEENLKRTGLENTVILATKPIQDSTAPTGKGVIILNPPYGERLRPEQINQLYAEIGDALKNRYRGWDAWILSSNAEAFKHIGLKAEQKIELLNGKIPCQFRHYPIA